MIANMMSAKVPRTVSPMGRNMTLVHFANRR